MKFITYKKGMLILISLLFNIWCAAQNTGILKSGDLRSDSLSLNIIIDQVLNNHPLIKELTENINSSRYKIELAKTTYLPNVEAFTLYSRMSPNPTITFPTGSIQFYPDNSFDAHIGINQLVYDFGKTKTNVALQQAGKEITELSVEQAKQKLSITTAVYFYSLVYLQEAEKIKNDQLTTLNKHLDFVTKKMETGSAIKYEIVSTRVKISSVENQLTEIKNNKDIQIINLNLLLGKPDYFFTVKDELQYDFKFLPIDSLYRIAEQSRDEMHIAKKKEELAQWNIKYAETFNKPAINFSANAGFKNGYQPEVEKLKGNYFLGLGARVPLFDANRTKINLKIQNSNLQANQFETENIDRTIMNEVSVNYSTLIISQKKIEQFKLQLEQAEEAYALAETNYQFGTITNLDLLDAASMLAESKLLLLKANIDRQINIIKLNASTGLRIY